MEVSIYLRACKNQNEKNQIQNYILLEQILKGQKDSHKILVQYIHQPI